MLTKIYVFLGGLFCICWISVFLGGVYNNLVCQETLILEQNLLQDELESILRDDHIKTEQISVQKRGLKISQVVLGKIYIDGDIDIDTYFRTKVLSRYKIINSSYSHNRLIIQAENDRFVVSIFQKGVNKFDIYIRDNNIWGRHNW